MHNNLMQENRPVKFATLIATTERRRHAENSVLVHTSGLHENGSWKPMRRIEVWKYLRQRSQGALA